LCFLFNSCENFLFFDYLHFTELKAGVLFSYRRICGAADAESIIESSLTVQLIRGLFELQMFSVLMVIFALTVSSE
jgi:hypothetical protein